ncbi:MAG: hypothetical protein ACXVB1_00170 [Pseudobdellovibrionaceae bacterium]
MLTTKDKERIAWLKSELDCACEYGDNDILFLLNIIDLQSKVIEKAVEQRDEWNKIAFTNDMSIPSRSAFLAKLDHEVSVNNQELEKIMQGGGE